MADFEVQGGGQRAADSNLQTLGYIPELARNRTTWSVMFMSFIMASVPFTISTTMSYTLTGGGPSNMIWGWVVVTLIMLCLGASLAEITSVYPTAGGVYYQTAALSPSWCRRMTAWICGWSYFAGQVTITLSVNFGATQMLIASLNVFKDANGVGLTDNFEAWHTYVIFLGITLFTHIVPSIGNKWLTYVEVCHEKFVWLNRDSANRRFHSCSPSFGSSEVLSLPSSPSLSLPIMEDAQPNGSLAVLSSTPTGLMAGPSVSVCSSVPTVFRLREWSHREFFLLTLKRLLPVVLIVPECARRSAGPPSRSRTPLLVLSS